MANFCFLLFLSSDGLHAIYSSFITTEVYECNSLRRQKLELELHCSTKDNLMALRSFGLVQN